jgi:hypothetical protein
MPPAVVNRRPIHSCNVVVYLRGDKWGRTTPPSILFPSCPAKPRRRLWPALACWLRTGLSWPARLQPRFVWARDRCHCFTTNMSASSSSSYPPNGTYGPPQQFFPQHQAPGLIAPRYDSNGSAMGYVEAGGPSVYIHDQYKGALNRNLIGSVSASAFGLTDTTDREGVWFVLQDLSVRLEGTYRYVHGLAAYQLMSNRYS